MEDIAFATTYELFVQSHHVRNQAAFESRLKTLQTEWLSVSRQMLALVLQILPLYHQVNEKISAFENQNQSKSQSQGKSSQSHGQPAPFATSLQDICGQLSAL